MKSWLLRMGKRRDWESGRVEDAEAGLTPRDDEELSVYKVVSIEEANKVAELFALLGTGPDNIDCILIPEECLKWACFDLAPLTREPCPNLPNFLRDRHCEIRGMHSYRLRCRIVKRILKNPRFKVYRICKSKIIEAAMKHVRDPELRTYLGERWIETLRKRDPGLQFQ